MENLVGMAACAAIVVAMGSLIMPIGPSQSLHTWFSKRFSVHRLGGLAFLLQYGG